MIQDEEKEPLLWYAMRATYHRELKAEALLAAEGVECFIPMRYVLCKRGRQQKRELIPVVRNLIFVRTTSSLIKRLKLAIPYLQYMTMVQEGRRMPLVVPERQMVQFMAVSRTYDDRLLYFAHDELNLTKGTRIRIHGGVLDGQEGLFLKIKGCRNRRIVVMIQGVIAVAMLADTCVIETIDD